MASQLPSRYEIRALGPEHAEQAAAISGHSNCFNSPMWSVRYPDKKVARFNRTLASCKYLVDHSIASGMSFGVFDKEYPYRDPSSAAIGGAFRHDWRDQDPTTEDAMTGDDLLERMDFPLVSVAMAYDGANEIDLSQLKDLLEVVPLFMTFYNALQEADKRSPESWKPTAPGQVLMRNGTATRGDYEGRGLMGALARYQMHEAKARGYRGIQIEGLSDAVEHVWMNPPPPYAADMVVKLHSLTYEEKDEKTGELTKPFVPADVAMTKIYVHL